MVRLAKAVAVVAVIFGTLPAFCQSNHGIVTAALKLRQGAGTHTARITTLYPGAKIEILDTDGEWYHVRTAEGRIGWVHRDYVRTSAAAQLAPEPVFAAAESSRPALADPPTDEWYRGVILCSWVADSRVNARERLDARRVNITRIDPDCAAAPNYVLIAFGSEVPLTLLQEVIRAFRDVPDVEIAPFGDSQYPGAIRIGLRRGDRQVSAELGDVADAILSLYGDETADELQMVRQYIYEKRKRPR